MASEEHPPSVIQWRRPPLHLVTEPVSKAGQGCVIELANGRTIVAQLVRFETKSDSIDLQLPDQTAARRLKLEGVRSIKLTPAVGLTLDSVAVAHVGSAEGDAVHEKPFTVRMRDGAQISGRTLGFVNDKRGLFLFVMEAAGALVTRHFVPVGQLEGFEVGMRPQTATAQLAVSAPSMIASGEAARARQQNIEGYLTGRVVDTVQALAVALAQKQRHSNLRLGEVLIQAKLLTPAQLEHALAFQATHREQRIGEILVESGVLSKRVVQVALSDQLGIPYVSVREFKIDPVALACVDAGFASRHTVLPILRTEGALVVAVEDPLALDFMQDLRFSTGLGIIAVIADAADLKVRIAAEYSRSLTNPAGAGEAMPGRSSAGGNDLASADPSNMQELTSLLGRETPHAALPDKVIAVDPRVSDNTLVRLINKMIVEAHSLGASDIHIESNPGQIATRIRFRRDGDLEDYLELHPAYRNSLVSRIKVMASLDISERRHPQDGKINFGLFGPLAIELRVAIIPTASGLEDVVLRLLGGMVPLPLDDIGFCARDLSVLKKMIARSYGLFLVCGPTGSGKTTTLHSILHALNRPDLKIWTAEDPIEITQPGLRQVQVQPKIDWTFAAAMRAFLRADPDIIMVGEMRDAETTKIGVEASVTGHLVFSTLHTNSAAESITRLLDLGMDPFNFADALVGILSQRLARTLCRKCKRARVASSSEISDLLAEYCDETDLDQADVLRRWQKEFGRNGDLVLYSAVGCEGCRGGYKGRVGVYELLAGTPDLKHLIRTRAAIPQLVKSGQADGMRLLRQDGIEKVLGGALDIASARAVCG